MNSAVITLLQFAASLLLTLKTGSLSASSAQSTIQTASRSIQISAQEIAGIPAGFIQVKNEGIWPNTKDLSQSLYLNARGAYVPLGQEVQLLQQYTSFGDMNADGMDDAVAVVKRVASNGDSDYAFAVMLNQNGTMFNITDLPTGPFTSIDSHHVTNGKFVVAMNGASGAQNYTLLGDQLLPY